MLDPCWCLLPHGPQVWIVYKSPLAHPLQPLLTWKPRPEGLEFENCSPALSLGLFLILVGSSGWVSG